MRRQIWKGPGPWMFLALLCVAPSAQAVITCSSVVTSITVAYNPAGATIVTSGTYTITCNRTGGDPSTVGYRLEHNQGQQPQGQGNRASLGASTITYGTYTDATLGTRWNNAPPIQRTFNGTLDFGGLNTASVSGPFYLEILAGQTGPQGTYTDVVATTLTYNGTSTATGLFNVNIITNANCTLTLNPTITFNYTSFQASPATPSANFLVNCTTGLPYTMTLDGMAQPAPVNVLDDAVNLNYSISLSSGGGTGTGTDQIHQIQGNMPANQGGTCGAGTCTNAGATNRTRTITVTF